MKRLPKFVLALVIILLAGCQNLQHQIAKECIPIASNVAGSYSFKGTLWNVFDSIDVRGNTWNDSTLEFVSQLADGQKQKIEGYFQWYSDGLARGKEHFTGHFIPQEGQLIFQGDFIENRKSINPSLYKATLCSDGKTIAFGTWSAPNTVPGKWSASLIK